MSSQIKPILVKDDLLLCDNQVNFAVLKGGQNVSFQKFASTAVSATSHSYTIQTPSTSVIMDREVMWHTEMAITVTGTPLEGNFLVNYGDTDCFAPFPLHQNVINLQAQINNTSVSCSTQQMLDVLLRNMDDDELARYNSSTPVQLDNYGNYSDITDNTIDLVSVAGPTYRLRPVNSPFNDYRGEVNKKVAPRGSYKVKSITGNTVQAVGATDLKTVVVTVEVTEPLMLSPFIYGDYNRKAQGIYGVSQINVTAQLDASAKRCFRFIPRGETVAKQITNISYSQNNSYLECRFITPHPSDLLPESNIVPYANFVNFQTVSNTTLAAGASETRVSSNIQLNGVPDKLFLFVREKQSLLQPYNADAYCAINSVRILWNNNSGLLSSATQEALWRMSVEAGCRQSWDEFRGKAEVYLPIPAGVVNNDEVATCGSVLVLDFAKHIALSEDYYAPSSLGAFNLQVELTYENTTGGAIYPELNVMTMSSGIFATQNGQSSVYTNVLNKQQVLDASIQEPMAHSQLQRYVGGGFFSSLKSIAKTVLPVAKTVLGSLGHPVAEHISNALGAAGYGMSAGAMSAGAITGGQEGGRKKMKNRLL